jgi:hypothetical protein
LPATGSRFCSFESVFLPISLGERRSRDALQKKCESSVADRLIAPGQRHGHGAGGAVRKVSSEIPILAEPEEGSAMKLLLAHLSLLGICLLLAAVPAAAQQNLYDNGPINGEDLGWDIVSGFVVSDTFALSGNSNVTGFTFAAWSECEGCGPMTSVDWSLTSAPNSGSIFASGTATSGGGSGGLLVDQYLYTNQFGYGIDQITVSGLNVNFANGGIYWLNLQNALGGDGYFFWDENSGVGCGGDNGMGGGCPSQAWENTLGTIPSESFTILGNATTTSGTTPEPGSIVLFASGMLSLAGVLRRKVS